MNPLSLVPVVLVSLIAVSCLCGVILCVLAGFIGPDLDEANGEEEGTE